MGELEKRIDDAFDGYEFCVGPEDMKKWLDEAKEDFMKEFFGGKETEVEDYIALSNYHDEYARRLHKKIVKWFGTGEQKNTGGG